MSEHSPQDHGIGRSHLLTAKEISNKKQEWFASSNVECTNFTTKELEKLIKPEVGKIPRPKHEHAD